MAADLDFLEDKSRKKPRPSRSQRRPSNDVLGNQLDSLLDSTFSTPNLAKKKASESTDMSSDTMIENAFRNSFRSRDPDKHDQDIARRMQFPTQKMAGTSGSGLVSRDINRGVETNQKTAKRARRTVRSRPTVGRTIEVVPEKRVDFGRALRYLEISCALNRIRQDLSRQRFHERPGMKRKRLKSERWRKLFKESFRATVIRVQEMRRKGW